MPSDRLYITLLLFVNEGKEAVFQTYESHVLPMLSRYEGELLYRIRPEPQAYLQHSQEIPYEIHLLSFASPTDFERFKQDEERRSYAPLFQESVRKVVLIEGTRPTF